MNCANLLAFIQVAIAFDFGLVILRESHIMKDIHTSYMKEMGKKYENITQTATKLLNQRIENITDRQREHRAALDEALKILKVKTDKNQGNWGKYAYLGLFGGIYGLICLLGIGMFDVVSESFNRTLRSFLLISAEWILAMGVLSVCQIHFMESKNASVTKILKKTVFLFFCLLVIFVFSYYDWSFGVFESFEIPFLWFTILIVSLPILVFAVKISWVTYSIKKAANACQEAIREFQYVIPPLAH